MFVPRERLKLQGFNNLTKVVSFNLYDFFVAMKPASRPITSKIMTRSWLSAVECRRSSASVAMRSVVCSKQIAVATSESSCTSVPLISPAVEHPTTGAPG